jgi:hypothetical protein
MTCTVAKLTMVRSFNPTVYSSTSTSGWVNRLEVINYGVLDLVQCLLPVLNPDAATCMQPFYRLKTI